MSNAEQQVSVTTGSGNVFEDLGFPDAGTRLAKAELIFEIGQAIERLGLSQTRVGEQLGMNQSEVSRLVRGRTQDFSLDKLTEIASALGYHVTITLERGTTRTPIAIAVKG